MTAGCIVLALLTLLVLDKQIRQMSDCLVRLDKAEIFKCIAVLKRNSRFIFLEMYKSEDISKKPSQKSYSTYGDDKLDTLQMRSRLKQDVKIQMK